MADERGDRRRSGQAFARTIGVVSLVVGGFQLLTANVALGADDFQGIHVARVLVGMFAALVGIGLLALASWMRRQS